MKTIAFKLRPMDRAVAFALAEMMRVPGLLRPIVKGPNGLPFVGPHKSTWVSVK